MYVPFICVMALATETMFDRSSINAKTNLLGKEILKHSCNTYRSILPIVQAKRGTAVKGIQFSNQNKFQNSTSPLLDFL